MATLTKTYSDDHTTWINSSTGAKKFLVEIVKCPPLGVSDSYFSVFAWKVKRPNHPSVFMECLEDRVVDLEADALSLYKKHINKLSREV